MRRQRSQDGLRAQGQHLFIFLFFFFFFKKFCLSVPGTQLYTCTYVRAPCLVFQDFQHQMEICCAKIQESRWTVMDNSLLEKSISSAVIQTSLDSH